MVYIYVPTEEDIWQAKLHLWLSCRWTPDILPDAENMSVIDFSEYYTEEEKEAMAKSLFGDFIPSLSVLQSRSTVPYKTICEKVIIGEKSRLSYKNVEGEQFVKEKPSIFPTKF